jgi:hypothetical protein
MARYQLPIEKNIEALEDAAADAVDRGDLQRANELLGMAERGEAELDGVDTARLERVKDALASFRHEPVSNMRELGAIRRRLRSSADGQLAGAAGELEGFEGRRLPDAKYTAFRRRVDGALHLLEQDKQLRSLAKQKGSVKVKSEPRVYGPKSENSYFADLAAKTLGGELPGTRATQAQARLEQYGRELAYEMGRKSKEGKRALRAIREQTRVDREDVHKRAFEQRSVGTGGGASATAPSEGSAFVSPAWLWSDYATYHGIPRVVAEACHKTPLPPYGMRLEIPRWTSGASATQQTENAAVSESSPAAGLEETELKTISGQVFISSQLSERGYYGGGSMDQLIGRQIAQQVDEALEKYVCAQILAASIGEVSSSAALGETEKAWPEFLKDVAKARHTITTSTGGVKLRPTHVFSTSDFYGYMTRLYDKQERPVQAPAAIAGWPVVEKADDGPAGQTDTRPPWSRYMGTVLPSGLVWLASDGIPLVGTSTRTSVLVAATEQALTLAEGQPTLETFVETQATTLRVVCRVRQYVALLVRHAGGVSAISGANYQSTLV